MSDAIGTLHRHDEGGPEASVICHDGTADASWSIPVGQLLADHPVLNTGGYVYFTLDATPTLAIKKQDGGEYFGFSGALITEGKVTQIRLDSPTPDVLYRAHILLAYDDGVAWHNDTQFMCAATQVTTSTTTTAPEELPDTGVELLGIGVIGLLLIVVGLISRRIVTR